MTIDVQFIEKGGQPEWAIIPYSDYQKLIQAYNHISDEALMLQALSRNTKHELLPHNIVVKLINGGNPTRILRQYRGKTMDELAQETGITQSYLSQLESSKKQASQKVLKALAQSLQVDIDDLIE